MADNALSVEIRQDAGKGVARKLRAAGRIPGVCYGKGEATVSITLDPVALRQLLEKSEAGRNTLIKVKGGGAYDGKLILVRELQQEPVRGEYLHADLYAVDLEQTVQVSVPVHLVGKAPGVELGGIVDHALREIELECMPLAIPKEIAADISGLDLGGSIHVRDLPLPEGVTLSSDPELSVVSVVAPKAEEEAPVEEEEAAEGVPAEGEEAAEGQEEAAAAPSGEEEKAGE